MKPIDRENFDAVIFDLDGVVTRTATLHARAWKQVFDDFLQRRAAGSGYQPFDIETDYPRYVDGKPRYDGVRSFLASRGIQLPEGKPDDPPDRLTVQGLGNRKNELYNEILAEGGVEVFEDTVECIRDWRAMGLKTAIVSSSKNCEPVLRSAGLTDLFDVRVDGREADRLGLEGKPAPDIFLEAARRLEVDPARAVIFEDAVSGVQAGQAGDFGWVVGVDRVGARQALLASGADRVVNDMRELQARGGG
ncbi:MAG: beta-phosphoglucomutase family hydrolase [Gemmatimonadetes bacterium]|uniref:Beta-phosphoglucomutase n=1 Tax=Candidatus Kutchimonas denitrificans TaxID=3056748 RepID=A0AAE4ZAW5_9BACT|nr:beta-phosphoglucomutase family hydrolase [Gemmatimonadota bacterium]NIR76609.1 beta-phosphoglucomutase family hydrolase [Candidatus Kutchimonas denitrificans]NIS03378.1 beta-phosphoglucomutase family hydrolase [Gemmatimonadota bacterium]NIT69239.1 beta-phosphoglucomutase family hydrolase [Gemmatimonadota bacterium]NIU54711.1 beta-phosphoglucomutase family hydrolase [Gemmatimonadota bacterium]